MLLYLRCFQQNFITPFIYSKIGSTSSGAALAAAVPALPELRNPLIFFMFCTSFVNSDS